jgi:hypothetical protein
MEKSAPMTFVLQVDLICVDVWFNKFVMSLKRPTGSHSCISIPAVVRYAKESLAGREVLVRRDFMSR